MTRNLFRNATLLLCLVLYISKGECAEPEGKVFRNYDEEKKWIAQALFEEWSTQFNKVYLTEEEFAHRFKIWRDNDAYIENHNSQQPPPSFTLGHNQFSDLTTEEFSKLTSGNIKRMTNDFRKHENIASAPASEVSRVLVKDNVPENKNWVKEGKVTNVKNQGDCGASWAFAAAATVESMKAIDDDDLVDLSVQQLIDCNDEGYGCNSGSGSADVFNDIDDMGGLYAWVDYPYIATKSSECLDPDVDKVDNTEVDEFEQIEPDTEKLMEAIADAPVWAAIVGNSTEFKHYEAGIFLGNCGSGDPGLAVEVVGYETGNLTEADFWLIKNSWGEVWGEGGYMRLPRSTNLTGAVATDESGKCGILQNAWSVSSAWYYGPSGCMLSFFLMVGSISFFM